MNYLTNYFGGGNAAGGLRKPMIDDGFNPQMMSSNQPSMNLGMTMPSTPFPTDMGTGLKPPSSFGQMPAGFDLKSALTAAGSLLGKQEEQQQPKLQPVQLPMGSNQSYEDLMKMYGVRSGGLLG
jgi:hypothetical protein